MQPRRTDAFSRTGVAGTGCQAATVADGRRAPETDAPRWRKCVSWMQGGPMNGERKPATGGWRAGDRARDARGLFLANRFILLGRIAVFHHAERFCYRQVGH